MYDPLRCHCGDYKCKNPVLSASDGTDEYAIDPTCNLCEGDMCKEHAHFVAEVGRIRRFVCDSCYRVCMMAYQNKQKG
jgi:hypothetical protein